MISEEGGVTAKWKDMGGTLLSAPLYQQAFPKTPHLISPTVNDSHCPSNAGVDTGEEKLICIANVWCWALFSLSDIQTPEDSAGRPIFCRHGHQADPPNPSADFHIHHAVQCLRELQLDESHWNEHVTDDSNRWNLMIKIRVTCHWKIKRELYFYLYWAPFLPEFSLPFILVM